MCIFFAPPRVVMVNFLTTTIASYQCTEGIAPQILWQLRRVLLLKISAVEEIVRHHVLDLGKKEVEFKNLPT